MADTQQWSWFPGVEAETDAVGEGTQASASKGDTPAEPIKNVRPLTPLEMVAASGPTIVGDPTKVGPEWHTGGPAEETYAPGSGATQTAVLAQRQESIDKINQLC
jgi:hypothetical protein